MSRFPIRSSICSCPDSKEDKDGETSPQAHHVNSVSVVPLAGSSALVAPSTGFSALVVLFAGFSTPIAPPAGLSAPVAPLADLSAPVAPPIGLSASNAPLAGLDNPLSRSGFRRKNGEYASFAENF